LTFYFIYNQINAALLSITSDSFQKS